MTPVDPYYRHGTSNPGSHSLNGSFAGTAPGAPRIPPGPPPPTPGFQVAPPAGYNGAGGGYNGAGGVAGGAGVTPASQGPAPSLSHAGMDHRYLQGVVNTATQPCGGSAVYTRNDDLDVGFPSGLSRSWMGSNGSGIPPYGTEYSAQPSDSDTGRPGIMTPPNPAFQSSSTDFTNDPNSTLEYISQNGQPSTAKRRDPLKKKPRQQFSACGACRQRRVKCDLKDKQEEWDSVYGLGPQGEDPGSDRLASAVLAPTTLISGISRRGDLTCKNCRERRTVCVDEYAAIKAAKRVRSDKRPGERKPDHEETHLRPHVGANGNGEGPSVPGPRRSDHHAQYHASFQPSGPSHPYGYHPVPRPSGSRAPGDTFGPTPGTSHGAGALFVASEPESDGGSGSDAPASMGYIPPTQSYPSHFPHQAAQHDLKHTILEASAHEPFHVLDAGPVEYRFAGTVHDDAFLPPPLPSGNYMPRPARSDAGWTSSNISSLVAPSARTIATSNPSPPRPSLPTPMPLAAVVSLSSEPQALTLQPAGGDWIHIPELSAAFFESAFFRRFHIQRPIIDPTDFTKRYLSHSPPEARHMGLTGAILCHVFYAWACSYGVDEHGELDVPERFWPGGTLPVDDRYVWAASQDRESQRLIRKVRTDHVVKQIMREIDDAGVMRRHSWDGVRCLLLILPLTEFTSTPTERLAIYECAVAQVFALCSLSALNYEGQPLNLGSEADIIRIRLYWYTFVHEGITTGLKGGRLVLEEEDLESFQGTLPNGWALVNRPSAHRSFVKFATAPIRLSLACRAIHKALTGSKARRQDRVHRRDMEDAWEALEQCWEEFESIREDQPPPHLKREDVIRFSDGWKIFMFEAHNVIRESLEHRVTHLMPKPEGAFLRDLSIGPELHDTRQGVQQEIYKLHQIARAKCEQLTRQIVEIVRVHVHTSFFEWDASLVRDGTFYAAMSLAREGGSQADVAVCLQALNEMRWAYAKTGDRSQKLRDLWTRHNTPMSQRAGSGITPSHSDSSVPPISPEFLPSTESLLQFQSISGLGANIGGWFPEGMMGDAGSVNPSSEADVLGNVDEYDADLDEDRREESGLPFGLGSDMDQGGPQVNFLPEGTNGLDLSEWTDQSGEDQMPLPLPTNGHSDLRAFDLHGPAPPTIGIPQQYLPLGFMWEDRIDANAIAAWQHMVPPDGYVSTRRPGWSHESAEPRGS